MSNNTRGQWGSSFGFIMAAAGSAVGLGNLWKFPYVAGQSGGAIFLFIYVFFILILGIPLMLGEMTLGRKTQLNAVGTFEKLNPKWKFIGFIGLLTGFVILSYYSVVGGWVIKYILTYITQGGIAQPDVFFSEFTSGPIEPVIWHIVFMIITMVVVVGGVSKGIEKASKIMLPGLFILIIIIAIRSLTLPGAMEGVRYFLVPNFENIDSFKKFSDVVILALGQVFFSLSLGMGCMITYGSYLKKDSNLQRDAVIIPVLDSMVAILAGFAILPAVFALGFQPSAGPGLIFETLPAVFSNMSFGLIFAILFFILVLFAAITSSVSLLEVVASYFIDTFKWSRVKSVVIVGCAMTFTGIFAALATGTLGDINLFGMNIFDSMGFLTDKILMPLGALLLCIFIGHIYGIDKITEEISNQGEKPFKLKAVFSFIMKYIAPVLILVIFISSFLPS